jgi:hypothetical protein
MVYNFKDFLNNLVLEELHPELLSIVKSKSNKGSKQSLLAKKVKELNDKGETTGVEGNMPKGSSRAYLKHDTPEDISLDGKPAKIKVGTKVAIHASLDNYHDKSKNLPLGNMQNRAENGDYITDHHRILTKDDQGEYHTNHHSGIFPPLIDHDQKNHEWSKVGHVGNVSETAFKKITKTPSHPDGISHDDFCAALSRTHNKNNGRYWQRGPEHEKHLDHIDTHPLVKKFQEYHDNTANPPHDYRQLDNMGVFHHPDGSKHIVARDHGYDSTVEAAYKEARHNQSAGKIQKNVKTRSDTLSIPKSKEQTNYLPSV